MTQRKLVHVVKTATETQKMKKKKKLEEVLLYPFKG